MFKFVDFARSLSEIAELGTTGVAYIYPSGYHPGGHENGHKNYGKIEGIGWVRLLSDAGNGDQWRYQMCGITFEGIIIHDGAYISTEALNYIVSRVRGEKKKSLFYFPEWAKSRMEAIFEEAFYRNKHNGSSQLALIASFMEMGIDTSNVTNDEPLGGMEWSHHDRQTWQTIAAEVSDARFEIPLGSSREVVKGTHKVRFVQEDMKGGKDVILLDVNDLPQIIKELQHMQRVYSEL